MHALVVFESMYGNTRAIAEAIAAGLSTRMSVEVKEVGVAPEMIGEDVALLVVGGPTHAHGMSKPETRHTAAERADPERAVGVDVVGAARMAGRACHGAVTGGRRDLRHEDQGAGPAMGVGREVR